MCDLSLLLRVAQQAGHPHKCPLQLQSSGTPSTIYKPNSHVPNNSDNYIFTWDVPASKSSAWRNSSCRCGFCAPLLGWPLRPQTLPQGESPPADHLCKRELTTNKWLWVQEILGPCQGGLSGGHSHTQRPPVKGSSRGTRWMLMLRFSGLGFLLTRNEGKKPRRWGAVISGVRKTLSNVWIKGAGRWKQRSHEGDCCYGVLTPKNNFIQLVVFLRLCLATHDRAGKSLAPRPGSTEAYIL